MQTRFEQRNNENNRISRFFKNTHLPLKSKNLPLVCQLYLRMFQQIMHIMIRTLKHAVCETI